MFEIKAAAKNQKVFDLIERLVSLVREGINDAVEDYGDHIIQEWRDYSDRSAVPGEFSLFWKRKKEAFGLFTDDFQRLGEGDSRSYYRNLTFKKIGQDTYFVGVLDSEPAYKIKFLENGRYEVKAANYSLADVAEQLEKTHHLWKQLRNDNMGWLRDRLVKHIIAKFVYEL